MERRSDVVGLLRSRTAYPDACQTNSVGHTFSRPEFLVSLECPIAEGSSSGFDDETGSFSRPSSLLLNSIDHANTGDFSFAGSPKGSGILDDQHSADERPNCLLRWMSYVDEGATSTTEPCTGVTSFAESKPKSAEGSVPSVTFPCPRQPVARRRTSVAVFYYSSEGPSRVKEQRGLEKSRTLSSFHNDKLAAKPRRRHQSTSPILPLANTDSSKRRGASLSSGSRHRSCRVGRRLKTSLSAAEWRSSQHYNTLSRTVSSSSGFTTQSNSGSSAALPLIRTLQSHKGRVVNDLVQNSVDIAKVLDSLKKRRAQRRLDDVTTAGGVSG